MPAVIERMWERIVEAHANFYDFLLWLNEFSVRFFESEFAIETFGENGNIDSVFNTYAFLPYFLLLIGLAIAIFGRRLFSIQKSVFAFVCGFAIGGVYIASAVTQIIGINHFIIGVAMGLVFAVFRTPFYLTVAFSVITYFWYYECVNRLNFGTFFAFVVALILTVLIFMFLLRWLELVGTALFGGYIVSSMLARIIGYSSEEYIVLFRIILFLVAAGGIAVQILWRRKRKNDSALFVRFIKFVKSLIKNKKTRVGASKK